MEVDVTMILWKVGSQQVLTSLTVNGEGCYFLGANKSRPMSFYKYPNFRIEDNNLIFTVNNLTFTKKTHKAKLITLVNLL